MMTAAKKEVRLEGRIEMHLGGGYSKLSIKLGGTRMIDVATEKIPAQLRNLGTKVLVVFAQADEAFRLPQGTDSYYYDDVRVEEFDEGIRLGWSSDSA